MKKKKTTKIFLYFCIKLFVLLSFFHFLGTRPEIQKYFCPFFGSNENFRICFQDKLTFRNCLHKKDSFFDIHENNLQSKSKSIAFKVCEKSEAFSNSFYWMVEKVTLLCPLSLDTNIIKFTIPFRAKIVWWMFDRSGV